MQHARIVSAALALLVLVPVAAAGTAEDALSRLKSMEGTWRGTSAGQGEAEAEGGGSAVHEFRVSAAGTVVMETMDPGGDHEMINMYHVDGDDLVLTHYCAGGNQPRMRLDPSASTESTWVFEFTGGTNLDPKVDTHIHSARLEFGKDGALVSSWTAWNAGAPAGEMTFHLKKGK